MKPETVGALLHWSYSNLAMAHAAISRKASKYGQVDYMVRSRLYKGLETGKMSIGPLADDERLKMILPRACCYCASTEHLAADHVIPRKKGGADSGENLVWACRSCNSSKHATDMLVWMRKRGQFPSILLLRRYLKLALEISAEHNAMDAMLDEPPELPFSLDDIPTYYPPLSALRLWVVEF